MQRPLLYTQFVVLQIRLFNHYPTVAILMFDTHLIVYHYDYQVLGSRSPATVLRRDSEGFNTIRRLRPDQGDLVPAELVMRSAIN